MKSNPFLATKATKPQAVPLAEATHVILGGVQYRIVGRGSDYLLLKGTDGAAWSATIESLMASGALMHNFRRPGA